MANNCSGNSLPVLELPSCTQQYLHRNEKQLFTLYLFYFECLCMNLKVTLMSMSQHCQASLLFSFLHFCVLQVSAWGGYVFIINLIPLHVFVLLLMQRYSKRVYIGEPPLRSNMRTST